MTIEEKLAKLFIKYIEAKANLKHAIKELEDAHYAFKNIIEDNANLLIGRAIKWEKPNDIFFNVYEGERRYGHYWFNSETENFYESNELHGDVREWIEDIILPQLIKGKKGSVELQDQNGNIWRVEVL